MLIVLADGAGCGMVAKHLIDNHRFIGRNTLPKTRLSPGARVVVRLDKPLANNRDRMTLARRTRKLGGLLVWLDYHLGAMEATLPDPTARLPGSAGEAEALAEADALVALLLGEGLRR